MLVEFARIVFVTTWQALIRLIYVLILAEYLGRIGIGLTKPIVAVETPPGAPGSLVLIVPVLGLALSLRGEASQAH